MSVKTKENHKQSFLDSKYDEVKELILLNSSSIVADTLNEKYGVLLTRRDIDNYIFYHRKDLDVVNYRRNYQIFDLKKARREDEQPEGWT